MGRIKKPPTAATPKNKQLAALGSFQVIKPHVGPHGWDSSLTRALYGESHGGERTQVLSYGGGRQTVGMLALVIKGVLPKPDYIVMADTSREWSTTWEYLERYVEPVLKQHGLAVEIISHDLSSIDLFTRSGGIAMPMFTPTKDGRLGPMTTLCSGEWKRNVVNRYMRSKGVKRMDTWLGFGIDESSRMAKTKTRWVRNVFPLADLEFDTAACEAIAIEVFGAKPVKSSCFMCPYRRNAQWRELKQEYPDEWREAIEIDTLMRLRDPDVYLHYTGVPLEQADLGETTEAEPSCDSGFCWT